MSPAFAQGAHTEEKDDVIVAESRTASIKTAGEKAAGEKTIGIKAPDIRGSWPCYLAALLTIFLIKYRYSSVDVELLPPGGPEA